MPNDSRDHPIFDEVSAEFDKAATRALAARHAAPVPPQPPRRDWAGSWPLLFGAVVIFLLAAVIAAIWVTSR